MERRNGVDYIFGLAGNAALHVLAYEVGDDLKVRRDEAGVGRMHGFADFAYNAGSGNRERRVVARLEATTRGFDARYIVTSLPQIRLAWGLGLGCAKNEIVRNAEKAKKLGPLGLCFAVA